MRSPRFPGAVRWLMGRLEDAGFSVRVVGGALRDFLRGEPGEDWDLSTDACPEEVTRLFSSMGKKVVPHGWLYGSVKVILAGHAYDITSLRTDVRTDGRFAEIAYTNSWKEDAARRDFTVNAMSMDRRGVLYDYFGGQRDLELGRIRLVGDANARIREDYLRSLRFFRFWGRFGTLPMDGEALKAIGDNLAGLRRLSGERIRKEFMGILQTRGAETVLVQMEQIGIFGELFPRARARYFQPLEKPILRWMSLYTTAWRALQPLEGRDKFSLVPMREEKKLWAAVENILKTDDWIDSVLRYPPQWNKWAALLVGDEKREKWLQNLAPLEEFPVESKDMETLPLPRERWGWGLKVMRRYWLEEGGDRTACLAHLRQALVRNKTTSPS